MPAEQDDQPQMWKGPDPRSWPHGSEIWQLVLDIEAVGRVVEALRGSTLHEAGPAYPEAAQFLLAMLHQLHAALAGAILRTYGLPIPDEEHGSAPGGQPFPRGGKPRAFGAAQPPSASP